MCLCFFEFVCARVCGGVCGVLTHDGRRVQHAHKYMRTSTPATRKVQVAALCECTCAPSDRLLTHPQEQQGTPANSCGCTRAHPQQVWTEACISLAQLHVHTQLHVHHHTTHHKVHVGHAHVGGHDRHRHTIESPCVNGAEHTVMARWWSIPLMCTHKMHTHTHTCTCAQTHTNTQSHTHNPQPPATHTHTHLSQ